MNPSDGSSSRWIAGVLAEHECRLVRYAAGITGDVERARDVVQDVFLQLCRTNRAEVEAHVTQWLFAVCRNRALDVRRKEQRMKATMNGQLEREATSTEERSEFPRFASHSDSETSGGLLAALATLPERQQEVLRLKFQAGLSYAEIGRVTDLTVTNVGFLIHTALKKLREQCIAADVPARSSTSH